MKTILSTYEKSDNRKSPTVYSKTEVVTKQMSKLANQATTVREPRISDLTKFESNYDLDQISKYLS